MNKAAIPVMVRQAWNRHRFDIDLVTYIEELLGFIETSFEIDAENVLHPVKGIVPEHPDESKDLEAEILALCAKRFAEQIDKLYPVVR